jgi:proline dehydrogenase
MGLMRSVLLAGSQSAWLRERATRARFVRRAVSRFMPGETVDAAFDAARALERQGLGTVFTRLGENVRDAAEAEAVTRHYLGVLDRVPALGLTTEISVKLTQLGLDLGFDLCMANMEALVERARLHANFVWIDMESSEYVDRTLDVFRRLRAPHENVGICLQAYLYRTAKDIEDLLPLGSAIRLVKGAYREPATMAFPKKKDVDANYLALATRLLATDARHVRVRLAVATHDRALVRRVADAAAAAGVPKNGLEYQMLYGIQREEQLRLPREGHVVRVLIAYGDYWFPWYMRRLAERPANLWFVARNLFS